MNDTTNDQLNNDLEWSVVTTNKKVKQKIQSKPDLINSHKDKTNKISNKYKIKNNNRDQNIQQTTSIVTNKNKSSFENTKQHNPNKNIIKPCNEILDSHKSIVTSTSVVNYSNVIKTNESNLVIINIVSDEEFGKLCNQMQSRLGIIDNIDDTKLIFNPR